MKKLTLFALLIGTIFLFSFNDYGTCMGTDGYKSITCGACHGGSISSDVFILDGKTEIEEEVNFEYLVRIPTSKLSSLQLGTRVLTPIADNPSVNLDIASEMSIIKDQTLFSLVNINEKSIQMGEKEVLYSRLSFTFDKPLTEATTIAIQGVLSNGDGTTAGDKSFYKELVLEPSQPIKNKLEAYYFDHSLFLDQVEPTVLRIIDLQGRIIQSTPLSESMDKVDLSNLIRGTYIAVFGTQAHDMQSLSFQVD